MKFIKPLLRGAADAFLVLSLALSAGPSLSAQAKSKAAVDGVVGGVRLITDRELEIAFSVPIENDAEAKASFAILIDGKPLPPSEWEYLSYFNFGPYAWTAGASKGGAVNIRLKTPLDDHGTPLVPLGRQRSRQIAGTNTYDSYGRIAAGRLRVSHRPGTKNEKIVPAAWMPFYGFSQRGHMSMMWAWGSSNAGKAGVALNNSKFSAITQDYDARWVTDMLGEGISRLVGRSEYLNIPMIDAGFKAVVVGPGQSVYEAPEYRELFDHKKMGHDDVYGRRVIHGTPEKAVIVATADDVMRHESEARTRDGRSAARPKSDFFYFGEAFLRLYYKLGVEEGCKRYPHSHFNEPDDYRYDRQIEAAFRNIGIKWPGTAMRNSAEDYYVYGAMVHFEFLPESANGAWQPQRFPVNTRAELEAYDKALYTALSGIHGKYEYFSGTADEYARGRGENGRWGGWGQGGATNASMSNDIMKKSHPWFWRSQVDNFGSNGRALPPLAIEHVHVISDSQIEIKFNREISTIAAATNPNNWKVFKNGTELTNLTELSDAPGGPRNDLVQGGYAWKAITLNTGFGRIAYRTENGISKPLGTGLDKPLTKGAYGRGFGGFTQADLDERKISKGGWIANDAKPSPTALKMGEFVDLNEAIRRGAKLDGVIKVEYVGVEPITDWRGNRLAAGAHLAEFQPWLSNAYRSPLTGYYIYADTQVSLDTLKTGAYYYDLSLANNSTVAYRRSSGGEYFPAQDPFYQQPFGLDQSPADYSSIMYLHEKGTTYDRVGQRIADGAVANGGGMQIVAGSVYGHHPAKQPTHRGQIGVNFHNAIYVEGWGGNTFQCEDVNIWKDLNLNRYKNESLFYHEGGHGIDSFTQGYGNSTTYARNVFDDVSAAWLTSTHKSNGRRWHDVNEVRAYCGSRVEYISVISTYWHGTARESFLGINDGTWTPINTREELLRYDPFAFEVFKRIFFNGELGLWYENKVGDPDYRVLASDWILLRERDDEFAHWDSEDNLIAWGATVPETAHNNPYTGESNPLINWISWNTPNVWDIGLKEPQNGDRGYPYNTFDFKGRDAYVAPQDRNSSPTTSQEHPFFRPGGVKKPSRPPEIETLLKPVEGTISDVSLKTPVLVRFRLSNYKRKVTMDNAQTSFELKINGKQAGFNFWSFEESGDAATVTLRIAWPVDEGASVDVGIRKKQ
ncbi:MAG: hypothetical protein LBC63_01195 [Holophagales bacterium]|jgi:hypothetical protein|nr:hypothetical protein [Holophagales bacterium]